MEIDVSASYWKCIYIALGLHSLLIKLMYPTFERKGQQQPSLTRIRRLSLWTFSSIHKQFGFYASPKRKWANAFALNHGCAIASKSPSQLFPVNDSESISVFLGNRWLRISFWHVHYISINGFQNKRIYRYSGYFVDDRKFRWKGKQYSLCTSFVYDYIITKTIYTQMQISKIMDTY